MVRGSGKTAKSGALPLADRPPLDPATVQRIVVEATPEPDRFSGPDQPLLQLGVIDDTQASLHRARIQGRLGEIGWHIKRVDIGSGPTVSVGDCTDSVLDHAF